MKSKFFVFVLALGFTTLIKAQMSIMPKAGSTINSIDFKTNVGKEKLVAGFVGGVALELPINNSKFSIVPEVLFANRGVKLENPAGNTTITLNYLDIPILARYHVTKNFFINAGPSLNFALSGNSKTNGVKRDVNFSNKKESNDLKRLDLAVAFGLGGKFPIGNGSIIIDARYNFGLLDVDNFSAQKTRNGGAVFSIGYAFILGNKK